MVDHYCKMVVMIVQVFYGYSFFVISFKPKLTNTSFLTLLTGYEKKSFDIDCLLVQVHVYAWCLWSISTIYL